MLAWAKAHEESNANADDGTSPARADAGTLTPRSIEHPLPRCVRSRNASDTSKVLGYAFASPLPNADFTSASRPESELMC